MLNPEKYINEKRLLGHAKHKASKYKWSPRLGKYVRVHTQPTTPKNITERRENGDKKYRRYKLGDGLFLRSYPDGHKEIWNLEGILWKDGQDFPDECMIDYYHLDHKYLFRKRKYGW